MPLQQLSLLPNTRQGTRKRSRFSELNSRSFGVAASGAGIQPAMRFLALATDYDGTLASGGRVAQTTLGALERLRASGRRLILVTGRELDDLRNVFRELGMFDRVVAENGAVLYRPEQKDLQVLAEHPPENLIRLLRERGVPFSVGRGIIATVEPHHAPVLEAIRELGLELQVIFNKGAVMVLPTGVNKATGLHCALSELGLVEHNVVAIGDAENDHALLSACEIGVAVANAVPTLKERADLVMEGARGAGVEQLIAEMLEDDLARYDSQVTRHSVLLGTSVDGPVGRSQQVCIAPYRGSLLFAGPSGSGKSMATTGVIERVGEQGYQFCIIDPEGDYEDFPGAIVLGTATDAPNPSEVLKALEQPKQNVVVNLIGVPLEDRPLFFASFLPRMLELRARTARPHWIVVDETHHLLPSSWTPAPATLPQSLGGLMMITVHPDWISPAALAEVEVVIAVGKKVRETLSNFCRVLNEAPPHVSRDDLESGTAAVWFRKQQGEPSIVKVEPGKVDRKRHVRKYAEGELPPDRSFYFRGPQNRLKLRAQNLNMFLQLADGIDDESWTFHLERGDYSNWIREFIKDPELADEVRDVEQKHEGAEESRKGIRAAIERRYTAAA